MKYANPFVLLLIPAAVIAMIFLYLWSAKRKKQLLARLLGANSTAPEALHLSLAARRWKFLFYLAAAVVIICGIARPYCKTLLMPVQNSGRDIMVLFDVSKSMRATDLPPSRMEQAKFLLREIVNESPGDRFGLIAFAGNSFLSCPLTADHGAFNEYINELDSDTVPLGGTNIERALRTADKALAGAESSYCAVLMLTDGDELSGNASRIISSFKSRKIPLIIAGLGDPEIAAPVPDGKGGFMRQKDGTPASTALNETSLRRLAADTGGMYVRSTVGDTGAAKIVAELKKLNLREHQSSSSVQIKDEFPWFFAAGFILMILAAFISEVPRRRRANSTGSLLVVVLAFAALNAEGVQENKPAETLPQDALQLYNLARERQIDGDTSALPLYEEVIQKSAGNSELQSRALQNYGVGRHQEGRNNTAKAQQYLGSQQPDMALTELENAKKKFDESNAFYRQVLTRDSAVNQQAAINIRQLELDRRQLEKLKKEIEKLKKLQQQAQQQAQQAQQQNKQQPQSGQQNQQQNQQQQNKQQQPQSGQQNQQQKQQQQNKQQPQSGQQNQKQQNNNQQQQIENAAAAAGELAKQAEKLKQEKLQDAASKAQKELETAAGKQRSGADQSEVAKHLDEAVRALGKPEDKKSGEHSGGNEKSGQKKQDKESAENTSAQPQTDQQRQQAEKKRSGEEQLELLNDEASGIRRQLRHRSNSGRPVHQVEKDW